MKEDRRGFLPQDKHSVRTVVLRWHYRYGYYVVTYSAGTSGSQVVRKKLPHHDLFCLILPSLPQASSVREQTPNLTLPFAPAVSMTPAFSATVRCYFTLFLCRIGCPYRPVAITMPCCNHFIQLICSIGRSPLTLPSILCFWEITWHLATGFFPAGKYNLAILNGVNLEVVVSHAPW